MREIKKRRTHPHCRRATKYANDVVSGKIPACRLTILSCQRFLNDLAKKDFPYTLNRNRAERFCDFVELMPHVKGKWAGTPLKLEPWQSFIFVNLFGWENSLGLRRFRRSYIRVPRKNGKTTCAVPIGLAMLTIEAEPGAEIYCGATSEDQADEVFRPAKAMTDRAKGFKAAYGIQVAASSIFREDGLSFFKRIIGKPGEGQSPYCAIHDEYHEHKTSDQVDSMDTGMGARQEPLQFIITTAGKDTSSPCKELDDYAIKVLDGQFENESFFALLYGIDDKPQTFSYDSILDAVWRIEKECTCSHAKTTRIGELKQEVFAGLAMSGSIKSTGTHGEVKGLQKKPLLDAKTTLTGQLGAGSCARHVTSSTYLTAIQSASESLPRNGENGQGVIRGSDPPLAENGMTTEERKKSALTPVSSNTGSRQSNTPTCLSNKGTGVQYAGHLTSNSVSITAMNREESEEYYAKNATLESDYSEIIGKACRGHSNTCNVNLLKTEVSGGKIFITSPPDDWTDFNVWKKANPNIGVSVSEEYLRGKLAEAIQRTSLQNTVKTKHLNMWVNAGIGWINMAKWNINADESLSLDNFTGCHAWVGIDLASKIDLTAMMILVWSDGVWYLFGKYYLPQETIDLPGNEHYQRWQMDGHLIGTPGARTDYGYLEDDLEKIYGELAIEEVVYDPREAEYLMQSIREKVSCPVVEMTQSAANLSEPMKEFEAQYLAGNLLHNGDPVLSWSAGNVVLKESRNKLYYPAKENAANKIDPIVAAVMAMARAKATVEDLEAQQGFVEL